MKIFEVPTVKYMQFQAKDILTASPDTEPDNKDSKAITNDLTWIERDYLER